MAKNSVSVCSFLLEAVYVSDAWPAWGPQDWQQQNLAQEQLWATWWPSGPDEPVKNRRPDDLLG